MAPSPGEVAIEAKPESLQTWWVELGLAHTLVVDLDETITPRTWSTLAGSPSQARPASIDVEDLPAAPDRPGVPLGDVEPAEEIGKGAMGVVHAAQQHSLSREVAIKRLKDDAHPNSANVLINEARMMGQLEHPNIPPVHLLCRDGGEPVLVMKRIVGEVWQRLMRDEAHEAWTRTRWADEAQIDRCVGVVETLCDALHFAHSRGVLHRDIKPANVMIGAFGEVYLLDWGLAVRWEELKAMGPVVGTPAYMAPEMVEGQAEPRTDVYLLAASLHQAVTGSLLHRGKTLYDCLAQIQASEPPKYPPQVPAELVAILHKALARNPDDRYANVLEFQRALRAYRSHRAVNALVDQSLQRLTEAGQADESDAARLLTEARFGFLQALRDWQSPRARAGLNRASLALAEWEVEHGDLEAAARYLDDLDRIPTELQARVDALKDARARKQGLVEQAEQLDPKVGADDRTRYLAVLAALMVGLAFVVSWSASIGGSFGYRMALWGSGNAALLTAVSMVMWRERLFANAYNRRIMLLVILASCGIFLSRLLMMLLSVPMAHALVGDLMLLSMIAGAAGITVNRWTLWLSALAALAAVGAALLPAFIPWIVAGSAVVASGIALFFWRR